MAENPYKRFDRNAHAESLVDGMDGPAADMAQFSPRVTNPYQRWATQPAVDRPGEHVLPQPETPSIPAQLGRGVALAGRAVLEGANAIPEMASDLGVGARNFAEQSVNRFAPGLGRRIYDLNQRIAGAMPEGVAQDVASAVLPQGAGAPYESASSQNRAALNAVGLPEPETMGERFASRGLGMLTGTGLGVAAGRSLAQSTSPVSRGVGEVMARQPVAQGVAATTGAAGSQAAQEMGAGPGMQAVAGLAAGFAPTAAAGAVRGLARGGEAGRQAMRESIDAFEAAGTSPSVGQAVGNRRMQAAETIVGAVPGGGGVMASVAANTQKRIGERVKQLAAEAGGLPDANTAGRTIESGVRGFVARFRAKSGDLYSKLDDQIPANSQMDVRNAKAALDDLTAAIPGAENTSRFLQNPKLRDIAEAFTADLQGGAGTTLPYASVKGIRSRIGRMLAQPELVSDVPRAELKKVYAALSDDMSSHAQAIDRIKGNTAASSAFTRANSYHRAALNRLEDQVRFVSAKIEKAGASPEEIFGAVERNAADSGSRLLSLRRTLAPQEWDTVTSTIVQRMGRARPSAQGAGGDVFSTETFLTNWNKLTPQAKQALFGGDRYGKLEANLSKVAAASERIRSGSQVLANPSGTGNRLTNAGSVLFALGGLAAGNFGPAIGVASAAVSTDVVARLLTSPKFVGWLASQTSTPGAGMPMAMATLANVAEEDPAIAEDVGEYAAALARTAQSAQ